VDIQLMHLSVISYLLSKTFELGILALIVLFQPGSGDF
jgi:hypothetical protein